jgi:hypothetical protein
MKDHNPQAASMATYAKGVKDTLGDILSAMEGNSAYLRILAEKRLN